jgi:hypothetical protein
MLIIMFANFPKFLTNNLLLLFKFTCKLVRIIISQSLVNFIYFIQWWLSIHSLRLHIILINCSIYFWAQARMFSIIIWLNIFPFIDHEVFLNSFFCTHFNKNFIIHITLDILLNLIQPFFLLLVCWIIF